MLLSRLLGIPKGITAIIGSGGKTTAMYILADELSRRGTVICTTSTRIFPPEHLPVYDGEDIDALVELLLAHGCVCIGSRAENGKFGPGTIPLSTLASLADFVIMEADGSKGLPIKAHLSHEPVIPHEAKTTLLVVGGEGFGKPIGQVVHRAERFCEITGLSVGNAVTPRAVAAVINTEGLAQKIFVNQAESATTMECARTLAELTDTPVYAGALRKGEWICLS